MKSGSQRRRARSLGVAPGRVALSRGRNQRNMSGEGVEHRAVGRGVQEAALLELALDLDQRLSEIDTTTQSALDRTVASAEDLIDRIMSRAIIVIVVFFVALLGYRFAAVLVPRREE